jgi:hypothetical protein
MSGRRTAGAAARWLRCENALVGLGAEQARRDADQAAGLEPKLVAQVGDVARRLEAVLDHVALQMVELWLAHLRPGSPRWSDQDNSCHEYGGRVRETLHSASHGGLLTSPLLGVSSPNVLA